MEEEGGRNNQDWQSLTGAAMKATIFGHTVIIGRKDDIQKEYHALLSPSSRMVRLLACRPEAAEGSGDSGGSTHEANSVS